MSVLEVSIVLCSQVAEFLHLEKWITTGVAICFGLPSNYCTLLPPLQKISETNDTSFESPIIEVFESGKKLGVASSWEWPRPSNWKSNTFTKTRLEPPMIELPLILKLISSTTIQGFLLRYITLSYIIWLKKCRLSKFDENIGIWPLHNTFG